VSTPANPIRIAVFGTGFWAQFQIAGWNQVGGVKVVALYNRTKSRAEALAKRFDIPVDAVYDDAERLITERTGQIDVIDIITDVDTHPKFVHMAAKHGIPVICQKPMAPTLKQAQEMVAACRAAKVPYYIHENWRWQHPIRTFKQKVIDTGVIGRVFRARVDFITGFPVFENQPFLRELEQFILTDIGSHILDAARFMFGEAKALYCRTQKVHTNIKGEDVATVVLGMHGGATVTCNMAYAENYFEVDRFPETSVFVEGERGSARLDLDHWIRITTREGTLVNRYPPPRYPWADPAYDVVHASIAACNANLLAGLTGRGTVETTGEDNLKTVELVFKSYESAASGQEIRL
jgi:D-apiose dehydrogenase